MTTEQKEAIYGQIWAVYDNITAIEALVDEIINDETQKIRVSKIKNVLNSRNSNQNWNRRRARPLKRRLMTEKRGAGSFARAPFFGARATLAKRHEPRYKPSSIVPRAQLSPSAEPAATQRQAARSCRLSYGQFLEIIIAGGANYTKYAFV